MKKYILFLLLIFTSPNYGQENFTFEHISLEEGLSQSTVSSIFQDKNGFLWFGTENGLNKYDGYIITVYKHSPFKQNTLSSDIIRSIAEDSKGNLWIGTENGLNKFIEEKEEFIHYDIDSSFVNDNSVMALSLDKDNNFLVGTYGKGIYLLNPIDNSFTEIKNNTAPDSSFYFITTIYNDKKANLWIGSNGGLIKYNGKTKSIKNYKIKNLRRWYRIRILSIVQLNENELFVGTENGGLYKFIIDEETFTKVDQVKAEGVRSLFKDTKGNIWIGTYDEGIYRYCPEKKSYLNIRSNSASYSSLSDNSIFSIYEDNSHILWLGSFVGGVNKYVGMKNKFEHYKSIPNNPNSLVSNLVFSILKDSEDQLWIGTSYGLNKLDRAKNKYSLFTFRNSGLKTNFISGLYEDSNNNIWASSFAGLHKYDKKNKQFVFMPPNFSNGDKITSLIISEVYEDKDGNLWIGSRNNGVSIFDTEKNIFIKDTLIDAQAVISILQDKEGIFWFGTPLGLIRYDKNKKDVKKFMVEKDNPNSLSNNMIFVIHEDRDNNLWLGTYGGGLNKYDKKEDKFYYFSEAEGLSNNVIYCILPGSNNDIWLSTNKGLCRFNTKNYSSRSYYVSDGLQGYEFNEGAAFLANDGEMFFGGLNGLNSFYPDSIKNNPVEPPITILSVNVLGKALKEYKNKDYIDLSYNQNFISFEFAALDFTDPKKNKYQYKLEGFDKDWIFSDTRKYASYTNLSPGSYTFRVIGSNNDDIWNKTGAQISFVINPPFWQTWWFYSLSFFLLILLVFSIHRYRLRVKIKQIVEVEKMRKNIADDFHDELGHKLTKISLYSELMKRGLKGVLNGNEIYLDKINDAANTLYDDTKDFIWSIDPVKDTLYDLAVYLKDFGDELFDKTGIAFKVEEIPHNLSAIKLPMNWKRQLILLFKEAMNNILRHSQCTNVELSITYNEDSFIIYLFDDGKGFSKTDNKGRGLVNMQTRAARMEGELIIKSEKGSGTKISFKALKSKYILN